jgi:ferredoxin, 2Fe-2S
MVKVTFIDPQGVPYPTDVAPGFNAMQAAVSHGVPGIPGECGGAMACATCHVYVSPAWLGKLSPPSAEEADVVTLAAKHPAPESRLSCQIRLRTDLDGLVLHIPPSF